MPAECDIAKSQDVACVCMCRRCKAFARAQETESSDMDSAPSQGGEDCFYLFFFWALSIHDLKFFEFNWIWWKRKMFDTNGSYEEIYGT